ncbi:GIY-YIG nuclease family protein [Shewanella sp. AS1]|uniref:GIY-YIG nuclease family protein n=1 Tax=Shewanella sp. AS1 TaxID=2907626 RepID=UPI001F264FA9|nr:GIY-YIG nuclease family protein [Shewanella sp. AS1]MCE9680093.1 GIY-YIG nuclease family protein [Shewanella sp. AS1]
MAKQQLHDNRGPGFIYFIRSEGMGRENEFKIGLSVDPIQRSNELFNTSTPYPMYVHRAVQVQDMAEMEHTFHTLYWGHRIHPAREWFYVVTDSQLYALGYGSYSNISDEMYTEFLNIHIDSLIDGCRDIDLYCQEIDVGYLSEKHLDSKSFSR